MIITKYKLNADSLREKKEIANLGCNVCPGCGTNFDGIPLMKSWVEGIFKVKHMRADVYRCEQCGCEWESDKYEW